MAVSKKKKKKNEEITKENDSRCKCAIISNISNALLFDILQTSQNNCQNQCVETNNCTVDFEFNGARMV